MKEKDIDFFSKKEKITIEEAELLEKKLRQLEKKEKIRFFHLKDIFFNPGERVFANLRNNDIWIYIPPDFPTFGKLIQLKDLIKENEIDLDSFRFSLGLPPTEIDNTRKIKIVLNADSFYQDFLKQIQNLFKSEIQKIEFNDGRNTVFLENFDEIFYKKNLLNFLSFKIYFKNSNHFICSINRDLETLNSIFYIDEINPNKIKNYNFTLTELYHFVKKYNGNILIYGKKFYISDESKLQILNWIPIEEWEDFPIPIPQNPKIIQKDHYIQLSFFSYEDLYKFILLLSNQFKIPKNSLKVYYEWYEEERKDSIEIQLENLEKFIDSFGSQKDFKVYDRNVIIDNLCSFSYDYIGHPSKILFETKIPLENKNLIFNDYSLPLQTFLDIMEKSFNISK